MKGALESDLSAQGTPPLMLCHVSLGEVGVEVLRGVKQRIDPAGIFNPGVLVP